MDSSVQARQLGRLPRDKTSILVRCLPARSWGNGTCLLHSSTKAGISAWRTKHKGSVLAWLRWSSPPPFPSEGQVLKICCCLPYPILVGRRKNFFWLIAAWPSFCRNEELRGHAWDQHLGAENWHNSTWRGSEAKETKNVDHQMKNGELRCGWLHLCPAGKTLRHMD